MYHKLKTAAFDVRNVGTVDKAFDDLYTKCLQMAQTAVDSDKFIKEFLKQIELFLSLAVDCASSFRPALDSFSENYEVPPEPARPPNTPAALQRAESSALFSLASSRKIKQDAGLPPPGSTSASPEQLEAAALASQLWKSLASMGTVLTCSVKDAALVLLQDFEASITNLTSRKAERDNIRLQFDYYYHKTQKQDKQKANNPDKPIAPEVIARNKAKLEDNYEMYYLTNETLKAKMDYVYTERLVALGAIYDAFSKAEEMFFSTISDSLQIMELDIPGLKDDRVHLKSEELGGLLRRKEVRAKSVWHKFKTGVQLFNVTKGTMRSDVVCTNQALHLFEYEKFIAYLQKQLTELILHMEKTMKVSVLVYRSCLIFHQGGAPGSPEKGVANRAATLHTSWTALCETWKSRLEALAIGKLEEIKGSIAILRVQIKERDELANFYEYWKNKVEKDATNQTLDPAKAEAHVAKRDAALASFEAFNTNLKAKELGPFLSCRAMDTSIILGGVLKTQGWFFQALRDIFLTFATEASTAPPVLSPYADQELKLPTAPPRGQFFFSPTQQQQQRAASQTKGTSTAASAEAKTGKQTMSAAGLATIEEYAASYRRETTLNACKTSQVVADQKAEREARAGDAVIVPPAELIRRKTVPVEKIKLDKGQVELCLAGCNSFRSLPQEQKAAKYREFCENVARTPTLRSIDLSNTEIADDFCIEFAKMLKSNTSIEELNLNSNPIGNMGVQALCGALVVNSTLKVWKLHNLAGTLSRETQNRLLETLKNNTSLTSLSYAFPQRSDGLLKDEYLDRNVAREMKRNTQPSPESKEEGAAPEQAFCLHCGHYLPSPDLPTCDECGVSQIDPFTIYSILQKIGSGSFGAVYKAMDTRTSTVVAIKIMDMVVDSKALQSEIKILSTCDNNSIVRYFADYRTPTNYWIVMEYCGVGSLRDILDICNRRLHEDEIAVVMKMTLEGLEYLHRSKKIHRDIKAGNILLTHTGECKLADFGVSAELETISMKRHTRIGTPYWMAPEVLQAFPYDGKADVWSLAITAFELALGDPPHCELEPLQAVFVIPTCEPPTLPENYPASPEFVNFLEVCLKMDPATRPGARELLSHPFIANSRGKGVTAELVSECVGVVDASRDRSPANDEEKAYRATQADYRATHAGAQADTNFNTRAFEEDRSPAPSPTKTGTMQTAKKQGGYFG